MVTALELAYGLSFASLGLGIALTLKGQIRERSRAGSRLEAQEEGRGWRWFVLALLLAAAALRFLAEGAWMPLPVDLALLLAAGVLVWLRPGFHDAVTCERGVRSGWDVVPFGEFEEWRLVGDHLRFRWGGEWRAAPLELSRHGSIRPALESAAPGRESRFV